MSIFDTIKNAVWPKVKKAPSVAWWLLTKSPKLLRWAWRGAAFYAFSFMAEKLLDKAREEWPENEAIGKADTIAHAALAVENFALGNASSFVKAGYHAIPVQPVKPTLESVFPAVKALEPKTAIEAPKPLPPAPAPQPVSSPPSLPPVTEAAEPRQAAFMPVEPAERNRANLNTELAPDGLPEAGGYEAATGITWGAYGKPIGAPPTGKKNPPATMHVASYGFKL